MPWRKLGSKPARRVTPFRKRRSRTAASSCTYSKEPPHDHAAPTPHSSERTDADNHLNNLISTSKTSQQARQGPPGSGALDGSFEASVHFRSETSTTHRPHRTANHQTRRSMTVRIIEVTVSPQGETTVQ